MALYMRARVSSHARSSKFLLLNEEQNPAFDAEFHSREELETKFVLLERLNEDKPFNVLDLGGGNGVFVDQLLWLLHEGPVALYAVVVWHQLR